MLCGPGSRSEGRVGPGEARRQAAGSKGPMVVATPGESGGTVGEIATFPPTQDEKDYQPTAFSGSHISEVLQVSEGLRLRLEQLELQRDKERVVLQAAAAQAELRRYVDTHTHTLILNALFRPTIKTFSTKDSSSSVVVQVPDSLVECCSLMELL